MAMAFQTVSDEVSWTDWSSVEDKPRLSEDKGRVRVGHILGLFAAAALIVCAFYFISPTIY